MMSRGKLLVKKALEQELNRKLDPNNAHDIKSGCSSQTAGVSKNVDGSRQIIKVLAPDSESADDINNSSEDEPFSAEDSDDYIPPTSDSSSDSNSKSLRKYLPQDSQRDSDIYGEIVDKQNDENETEMTEGRQIPESSMDYDEVQEGNIQGNIDSNRIEKVKKKLFPPIDKKTRKKCANPDLWKKKKAAIARERGLNYVSQKGKNIPSKEVNLGMLCTNTCKRKCSDKVDIEKRIKLFSTYYKLNINAKNVYLFKSMTAKTPARPKMGTNRHKSKTFSYFVHIDNAPISVCKKAFCSIFQIGKKKVEYLQKSLKPGASVPSPDKRGKHDNRPHKLSDDVKEYIKEHISSFPAELSHYSRNNNPHKKYLSPILNISKMYNLYRERCQQGNMPQKYFVKYCTYAKIFSRQFNLSFGQPRSDTCSTCDSGKGSEEHKESYEAAFSLQRADRYCAKNNSKLCYLTIDLQQTLPLPKLTTSKAFYLRQMWMYNLGIHTISKNKEKANFFTWTEDAANRGSSEVCSALLTYIEFNLLCHDNTISHLVIWTDSCAGQNKNFLVICLYQYMILKGMVKTIDHKFPEVGHSYLDSDRDFGRIEKNLRKHESIALPDEYREIIVKSSKINQVTDMALHFRNFEDLASKLNLINRKKNVLKENVPFRDGIKWIRVDEYGSYLYKESYDPNTPFKKVDIIRNSRNSLPLNVEITRVGNKKYGQLSQEKLDNLKTQLPFIKPQFRWYYEQVINEQESKN